MAKITLGMDFMRKVPELLARSREVLGDAVVADLASKGQLTMIAVRTAIATGELKFKQGS